MLFISLILLLVPLNLFAWERDGKKAWNSPAVEIKVPVILTSDTINTWVVQHETGIVILEAYYRDKKTSAEIHYKNINTKAAETLMPYGDGFMDIETGETYTSKLEFINERYVRIAKENPAATIDQYVNELEEVINTMKAK